MEKRNGPQLIECFQKGYIGGEKLTKNRRTGTVGANGSVLEKTVGALDIYNPDDKTVSGFEHFKSAIYAGYFVPLFGHFITEFLPRYEQIRMEGRIDSPVLVHPAPFLADPKRQLRNSTLIYEFLEELELPFERLHFCVSDILVDDLYYTKNVIKLNNSVDKSIVEISKSLNARYPIRCRDKKIFLSRSRLKDELRKSSNAIEVDRFFLKNGYDILHPQEMTLKDQILAVCSARVLAGEEGSALHLSIFNPFLENCIILDSGRFTRPNAIPDTQKLLNDQMGCMTAYVPPSWSSGGAMQVGGRFVVDIDGLERLLETIA